MQNVNVPQNYNYIAAFLTLACNLHCSYCINHLSGPANKKGFLSGEKWLLGLNKLILPPGLPVTFQGGEPSVHPNFYSILKGLRADIPIDLLTNLQFNPIEFANQVSPSRLKRDSKYASIRVTYHPETMNWNTLKEKVIWMTLKGYSICVYGILHPKDINEINRAKLDADNSGIHFKTKEFLGIHENEVFGHYRYEEAVFSQKVKTCMCKTSELLIGSDGEVYRCHHDLYNKFNGQGNLLSQDFKIYDDFRVCHHFGACNPCDIKIKNNRNQEWNHTSVEILFDNIK
jgi:sulfatase maturation enzyme AslB (radical SAM superfamily)